MPEQIITIYKLFENFSWSSLLDIKESQNFVKIAATDDFLVKKDGDFLKISFYNLNKETKRIEKRKDYIELFVHKDLDPMKVINYWSNDETNSYGYNFSKEHWIFRKIFE
jgi:hypothetical protein